MKKVFLYLVAGSFFLFYACGSSEQEAPAQDDVETQDEQPATDENWDGTAEEETEADTTEEAAE